MLLISLYTSKLKMKTSLFQESNRSEFLITEIGNEKNIKIKERNL